MVTKKDLKDIERQLQEIERLFVKLGEVNPFEKTTAQDYARTVGSVDAAFTSLEAVIGSTQDRIIDLSSGLSDVNGQIKEILKGLGSKAFDDPFKNILKGAKGYRQIANQLSNIQEDLINYSEKDLTKLIQKQKLIDANLQKEANALLKSLSIQKDINEVNIDSLKIKGKVTDEEAEALALAQQRGHTQTHLNKALEENLRRVKNINKAHGLTGKLIKGIGGSLEKIGFGDLGLGEVQDNMKQLAATLTDNGDKAATFGMRFKVMKEGLKGIGKNLASNLKDPLVIIGLIGKGIKALFELGTKVNKEAAAIGQSFANFGARSSEVAQNLREMAASDLSLSTSEATDAMIALNKEFGTAIDFSKDPKLLTTFKEMSHDLGIGAENTAKLYRLSQVSGTSFENVASEIGGIVDSLNQANGLSVNQTEVMEMVANASAQVRANLGNNPKAIAEAAYHAKKLGYSLNEIQASAESTLDFESSIEKQLSAQLILGKNIDLTNYRRAAMSGSAADQAKELNRLIAENADDLEGNVLKQQEFASMLGISVEKVMEGIESQKLQQELGKRGIKDRAEAEKELQELIKRTGMTRQEAFATLDKQGLDAIKERNKAAELGERSLQQLKEIITLKLAPVAADLVKQLSDFANSDAFEKTGEFIATTLAFIAKNPITSIVTALGAVLLAQKGIPQLVVPLGGGMGGGLGTTAASTAAMGAGGGGGRPTRVPRTSRIPRVRGRTGLLVAGAAALTYGAHKMYKGSDNEESEESPSSMSGTSNKVIKLLERIAKGVEKLSGVGGGALSTSSFTSPASPSSFPESGGGPSMAGAGSLALGGGLLGGAALMGRQAGSAASSSASSTTTAASRTAAQAGKTLTGAAAQSSAQAGNATVTRATMKNGTKVYGAAAQKAVSAGSATATRATMNVAADTAQQGGGLFSKLNPTKLITRLLGKNVMKVLRFLTKMPAIATLMEGFFLRGDIQDTLANPDLTKQEKDFEIGKSSLKSIAGVTGGIGAAALVNLGNLVGLPAFLLSTLAYTGGDLLGRWLGGLLADASPSLTGGFGSLVGNTFFSGYGQNNKLDETTNNTISQGQDLSSQKMALPQLNDFISRPGEPVRRFNKGDIIIGGTNLDGSQSSSSSSSPNNTRVIQLLERLITTVEQGGDVYLDGNKVGTALGMASYRTQ